MPHRIARLALLACALYTTSAAQSPEAEAIRLSTNGAALLRAGRLEEATRALSDALTAWTRLDNKGQQAEVSERLAEAALALGDKPLALKHQMAAAQLWKRVRADLAALRSFWAALQLGKALQDARTLCVAATAHAEVQLATGLYVWALENLKGAYRICQQAQDPMTEAKALTALGDLHLRQGRYDDALSVLGAASNLRSTDPSVQMWICKHLGVAYSSRGRFEDAQIEFERARTLAVQIKDAESEGVILAASGRAYLQLGRYSEARALYERALERLSNSEIQLFDITGRGLRPLSAQVMNDLAELHLAEGNFLLARAQSTSALSSIRVDAGEPVVLRGDSDRLVTAIEGSARYSLALTLLAEGDPSAALTQLASVLTIARDRKDDGLEARVQAHAGVALQALNRPLEAARSFQEALDIQTGMSDVVGEIVTRGYAAALDVDRRNYTDAIAGLRRATDLVEELRGSFVAQESRAGFLKGHVQVPQMMTSLLATLAASAQPPPFMLDEFGSDYASAALHFAERSRARAWVEQLAASRAAGLDLPAALGAEERELNARREAALSAYTEPSGDLRNADDQYRRTVDDTSRFVDRLRAHADPDVRAYAALRYPVPVRVADIQKILRSDEVLIEYAVLSAHTAIWIVEKDRPTRLISVPLASAQIAEDVQLVRRAFQYEFELPADSVERLFRALVQPALDQTARGKRLIVVPDGVLLTLPVEALGERSADGWRFVADDWIVSYYPSATLLALTRTVSAPARKENVASRALLAMGDPSYEEGGEFRRLEATRTEVLGIAEVFGIAAPQPDLKLGAEARESELKRMSESGTLATYRVVHLAAHGVLGSSGTAIEQPALVFAHGDSGEDGFLTMTEVLGLRLTAELIVLSACQSALGELVPGEGIVGLMRAFFHAGARSAVVSQWRVADQSTSDLMRQFYEQFLKGACGRSDKPCALNEARRHLRATHPHPYYWAPFVFFGER